MDCDESQTIKVPEEARWVAVQREVVIEYLVSQNVKHAGVSLEPRWFLHPYLAIWAVRSLANPDSVGWWAISGDVPTDYITRTDEREIADVLTRFSNVWSAAADKMANGEQLDNCIFAGGDPHRATELSPLLKKRAEMLLKLAADIKL